MKKEYTGSAYIGVVGSTIEYGACRDSIQQLRIRQGDSLPAFHRFTKGYESRQLHLNKFYNETNHAFLMLLDQDHVHDPNTLETLREHKLPFVSGLYLRRQADPIGSVWFEPFTGKIPLKPFTRRIERGKLHKIGASGWGAMLIHRDVITAAKKILKGEWEIFESFMDIYPYDLVEIMKALKGLRRLVDEKPSKSTMVPTLAAHLAVLEREIKPLRWDKSVYIGSDIRFPVFAKMAGFQLMGDPDVRSGHMIDWPLHPDDLDRMEDQYFVDLKRESDKHTREMWKAQNEIARRADG